MPEEASSPSAGWRAVYAAMGANAGVEGDAPRGTASAARHRAGSRAREGTRASEEREQEREPRGRSSDDGDVGLEAWSALAGGTGTGPDAGVGTDADAGRDAGVGAVPDGDADTAADAGAAPGVESGRDRPHPLRGEVP